MENPVTDIVLTTEKLSTDTVIEKIGDAKCGAISLFVGTTRNHHNGKEVVKLEYECYIPMAEKTIKNICDEIRSKWPEVFHIAVHHRLGHVPVKNASIMIGISSPHREDSISATEFAISTLKAKAPIWKKEIYSDGSGDWKENKECRWKKDSKSD